MRRAAPLAVLALGVVAGCGHASPHAGAPHRSSSPTASARPAGWAPVRAVRAGWRLPFAVSRSALVANPTGSALVAGGMLPGDTSTDRVERVDLTTGRSRSLPRLAVPVHDVAGGTIGGRPTVYGGGNATEQSVIQALGPHGWRVVGHLPTTRSDLSVATRSGTGFVLGGYDGVGTPQAVLRASPDGRVRRIGSLRLGVRYAATAVAGQSAYLFGGEVDNRELGVVQRVDLATGRTRVVGRLPRPLGHAMAVSFGHAVLVVGGCTAPDRRTRAMWWFDPRTGRFRPAGRLPVATSDGVLARGPGGAWLLGGETGGATSTVTDRVVHLRIAGADARIMAP